MKNFWLKSAIILTSCLAIAWADPLQTPWLAFLVACSLYGVFFSQIVDLPKKKRFIIAALWYGVIQAVQLSWLATTTYHGPFILIAYALFIFLLATQFGVFALLIQTHEKPFFYSIFLAAIWALFEWVRLFFFAGFIWNPIGLALSCHRIPLQLASFVGVYGLSFIVMMLNVLWMHIVKIRTYRLASIWLLALFGVFIVGGVQFSRGNRAFKEDKTLSVAAVQTGMEVNQKNLVVGSYDTFIHPMDQWMSHLSLLKGAEDLDVIVFPESVSLFSAYACVYPFDDVVAIFHRAFGEKVLRHLAPVSEPKFATQINQKWYVSNAFIGQSLANIFHADVILGLEDHDQASNANYNAAFHFSPNQTIPNRYEKQILVPISEYIPLQIFRQIASRYGIDEFFTPGKGSKVFQGKVPLALSICYEECFGHMMRYNKQQGAKLFINLTNDGWFPQSSLPHMHFLHARLRSVEMGIPMIRACNTGISAVIDAQGKIHGYVADRNAQGKSIQAALLTELPLANWSTIYTQYGDYGVVCFCCLIVIVKVYSEFLRKFVRDRWKKIRLEEKKSAKINF